jgi:hypothetical protein
MLCYRTGQSLHWPGLTIRLTVIFPRTRREIDFSSHAHSTARLKFNDEAELGALLFMERQCSIKKILQSL